MIGFPKGKNWNSRIQGARLDGPPQGGVKSHFEGLKTLGLVSIFVALLFLSSLAVASGSSEEVSVFSASVTEGERATVDLTLDVAPGGLSGCEIAVQIDNGDVADFVRVEPPVWAPSVESLAENEITSGGDGACIKLADLNNEIDPGDNNIGLGTLTLGNTVQGTSLLSVLDKNIDNDTGFPINPSPTPGTLAVTGPTVNQPPTADFTYSPSSPAPGEEISFDGTDSNDDGGTIVSYEWDWTDDGVYEDNGATVTHAYDDDGTYTVRLRVTDENGTTGTDSAVVSVEENPAVPGPGEVENMSDEDAAEVLEGVDSESAAGILEGLSSDKVISVIQQMVEWGNSESVDGIFSNLSDERLNSIWEGLTGEEREVLEPELSSDVKDRIEFGEPEEGFPWVGTAVVVVIILLIAGAWYWSVRKTG